MESSNVEPPNLTSCVNLTLDDRGGDLFSVNKFLVPGVKGQNLDVLARALEDECDDLG